MKEIEIIKHYGYRHQIRKLAEEQYELIEALFENDKEHIIEEIADCLLLIKQFRDFYKIQDEEIREVYNYKLSRQERRMADEIQPKL